MTLKGHIRWRIRRGLLPILPLAVVASGLDAALLAGIRQFLQVIQGENGYLLYWVGAMVAVVGARFGVLWAKIHLGERISRWVEALLWKGLVRQIRRLPPHWFHQTDRMGWLRSLQTGIRTVVSAVEALPQALQAVIQLLVFMPVLLVLQPLLTALLFLLVLPVLAYMQRALRRLGRDYQDRLAMQGNLGARLDHWTEVVRFWSFEQDRRRMEHRIHRDIQTLREESHRIGVQQGSWIQANEALASVAVIVVLGLCGWFLQRQWMTAEDLVIYAAAMVLCYKPLKDCLRVIPVLREAREVLNRFQELDGVLSAPGRQGLIEHHHESEVRMLQCDFGYGLSVEVWHQLSWTFSLRRPLVIQGPNGVGKTTLLRVLCGLEQVTRGQVLVPDRWPRRVAFLAQQQVMPLWELLPRSQINQRWQQASSEDFLRLLLPHGLPEHPGLSAGQRQRVALAWVYCSDSDYLLLDEPFALMPQPEREPLLRALLRNCVRDHRFVMITSHETIAWQLQSECEVVQWPL